MMFGYTIVKKSELKRYQLIHQNIIHVHRWFAGWRDLDIIWDYILKPAHYSIETTRMDYAQARGTDVYGKPTPSEKE